MQNEAEELFALVEGYAIDRDNAEEDATALGCEARLEVRYLDRMSADDRSAIVEWLLKAADKISQGESCIMFTSEYSISGR